MEGILKKSILVVGDVMLDNYYIGDVNRISPEAPVPVFRKKAERSVLGGAANVAANLIAAGQKVAVMSMVGDDESGLRLKELFSEKEINAKMLATLSRETTVKTRFLAANHQQLMRMDVEDTAPISKEESELMLRGIKDEIGSYDLILISDYMKGLLTQDLCQGIIRLANKNGVSVVVDVKDPKYGKYYGATILKPNLNELRQLTGKNVKTNDEIVEASEDLRKRCNCQYVLTTLGARGMVLVGDGDPFFVKSFDKEVYDVSGAGDTTVAYLATCMAGGLPVRKAVEIANVAAGIQVGKVGTSTVSLQEVQEAMSHVVSYQSNKMLLTEDIASFRDHHANQKIVFTNGCFDILHVGHKRYLQQAATLGDILIVGVNSDASVKRLKGESRPVNTVVDRAEMLCALGFVDYVAVFDEDTPYELIKQIQPDVLVKGGDYQPDEVVGKDIVELRGGKVEIIPFVEGKSTTNIINQINEK